MAILGHVDAIIFEGGIGEHNLDAVAKAVEGLEEFGIVLDRTNLEDECYEGDFWAVSKSYSPYGVVFGTKDEAYEELMYYLNNSMYEKDNDL